MTASPHSGVWIAPLEVQGARVTAGLAGRLNHVVHACVARAVGRAMAGICANKRRTLGPWNFS
jgi:hypothetical protein